MGSDEYNPMQHIEVREKVGIAGLYVATMQPGARIDPAADVERMVIAAIHAAARPLLADVANLRSQAEATRAAAARERDRMRGNVDAWQSRAEAAEQRAEALEREVARLRAAWVEAVAEVAAMGAEPDTTGQVLTPRRSPATLAALREVARMLAEAQPAGEVSDG